MRTPAAFAIGSSEAICWRARISVGAISAPWQPASTAFSSASIATTVLPEPTSPCSSRSMRWSLAMSASISAITSCLRIGQGEGQRGDCLGLAHAVALDAAPGLSRACGADQKQRELVGQQLVIGQPHARAAQRARSASYAGACAARKASRETVPAALPEERRRPAIPADPAHAPARGGSPWPAACAGRPSVRR